ncbi:MAG: hypothetical protein QOH73_1236 [Gaiellaceae bacterium]|nr:hypothetical protein [Gaiellaceae bacterium]
MVLGSSWTSAVSMHSSKPRWAALFALCVASLWVVRRQWRLLLRVGCPLLPFVGLMILSTAWSVEPPVTLGRGLALAAVFVAAAALAVAIELRIVPAAHVGAALVVAMATVALGGLLLLAVSHNSAMHPGTGRLNGLGGDSNTVASLFALGMPLALALAFRARQRARWIASAAALLLGGSIVAARSRGALVAAAAGCGVAVALCLPGRRALRGLGAVALGTTVCAAAMTQPVGTVESPSAHAPRTADIKRTGPHHAYINAELSLRLEDDIGASVPGEPLADPHRSFLNSSGRVEAWVGALEQASDRPVVGYGFGTEAQVFVDRYLAFQGAYVEDAYIGLVLQLGITGLACLAFAFLVLGRRIAAGFRLARDGNGLVGAGFAGAAVGGLVLALSQSFLVSAGNVASLTFWLAPLAAGAALRQGSASQ